MIPTEIAVEDEMTETVAEEIAHETERELMKETVAEEMKAEIATVTVEMTAEIATVTEKIVTMIVLEREYILIFPEILKPVVVKKTAKKRALCLEQRALIMIVFMNEIQILQNYKRSKG